MHVNIVQSAAFYKTKPFTIKHKKKTKTEIFFTTEMLDSI